MTCCITVGLLLFFLMGFRSEIDMVQQTSRKTTQQQQQQAVSFPRDYNELSTIFHYYYYYYFGAGRNKKNIQTTPQNLVAVLKNETTTDNNRSSSGSNTADNILPTLQTQQQQPQSASLFFSGYEIVTTNYGWNTPADLNFSRRIVSGEFFNATRNHPHYNASAWADLELQYSQQQQEQNSTTSSSMINKNRTLVIFLDVDTCQEYLYPKYVKRKWWDNAEGTAHGRFSGGGYMDPVQQSCEYIWKTAESPILLANPHNRLVILNCFGFPRHNIKRLCGKQNGHFYTQIVPHPQVIFASYSELKSNCIADKDIGLAPPAIKPVILNANDRAAIANCQATPQQRPYLFSFQGRGGFGRDHLLTVAASSSRPQDFFVRIENQQSYEQDLITEGMDNLHYRDLLLNSTFGATPHGDQLYSYRFTETMSAGTIPVVYADDWLPPYNDHVIRWTDAAVFIPEADILQTEAILRAISPEKICQMQQYVLHIYDTYFADRAGWVRGLTKAALSQSNLTIRDDFFGMELSPRAHAHKKRRG